jgi:peptidoglycan/LPS O-acetylase OafA/YrhL
MDNVRASVVSPSPPSAPRSEPRFRGFDGLRGIAILLVIVYHGVLATRYPHTMLGPARQLLLAGWTGVDLFFALSGFLITSLLLREEQREVAAARPPRFSLGRFYVRRVFRILPAFYAVLWLDVFVFSRFAVIPAADLGSIAKTRFGLWPFASFWGNYAIAYLGAAPAGAYDVFWSLCVEEHFYLLWPLFLMLAKSLRIRVAVAVAVGALLAVLRYIAIATGWEPPIAVHYLSHYRIDSILWGGTAALLSSRLRLSDRPRRLLIMAGAALVLGLILTDTMSVFPVGKPLGFSLGFTLLSLTASLLLLELVAQPGTWVARLLEFPMLVRLGKVSYGMYLLHLPMMDLGMVLLFASPRQPTPLNLLLAIVLFVVMAYAAAWVLYRIVEKPCLAIKDRLRGGVYPMV